MSVTDMVQALRAAGFSGKALLTMTSLGISESGGDPAALNNNPSTGDYSVGWFQINYFDGLNASRTQKYGPPAYLQNNPQAQANAAWDLSGQGTTFTPWQGDFTNGKYYKNLPAAAAAIASVAGTPIAPVTGSGSTGSTVGGNTQQGVLTSSSSDCILPINWPSVASIGGGSTCLFYGGWARAALGGLILVGGSVLILVGALFMVGKQMDTNIPGIGKMVELLG